MKNKLLALGIFFSSLIGYLEWGAGQHLFLFEAEVELFRKAFIAPLSVLHPFTVLPLIGQFLLLIYIFQKIPKKVLVYVGIGCIGLLLLLILAIGIIGMNAKQIGSTLPFTLLAVYFIIANRKKIANTR